MNVLSHERATWHAKMALLGCTKDDVCRQRNDSSGGSLAESSSMYGLLACTTMDDCSFLVFVDIPLYNLCEEIKERRCCESILSLLFV